jgi:DnaK suppressor protein
MLADWREDSKTLAARLREAHGVCEKHEDIATASLIEVWIERDRTAHMVSVRGKPPESFCRALRRKHASISDVEAILNIEEYKQRLQAEERRLLDNIKRSEENARELSDGLPHGDWSDASVSDEEKEDQFQEVDSDLNTLKLVRDALKRIEEGTFGKCLVDGGPIQEQRLNAVPWTACCLMHEQLLEKQKPRRMPTL